MPTNDANSNESSPFGGPRSSAAGNSHPRKPGSSRPKVMESAKKSHTRFADRSRKRGRILIALTTLCVIEFACALLKAPSMNVKHLIVDGITSKSGLTNEEIEATRSAAMVSTGTNWLRAPISQIHHELTALPWVRSASVGRRLPTDLIITIEPRLPSYSVITSAGRYEVAADNAPIRPLRREMENRLTPIVIDSSPALKLGAAIDAISVCTGAQIVHQTQGDTVLRIAKIEIDRSTNIWLNMGTGVRIRFGNCERVDEKIALLRRLLSHDRANRFAEINVSNPDWPAGKLQSAVIHPTEVASAPPSVSTSATVRTHKTLSTRTQARAR